MGTRMAKLPWSWRAAPAPDTDQHLLQSAAPGEAWEVRGPAHAVVRTHAFSCESLVSPLLWCSSWAMSGTLCKVTQVGCHVVLPSSWI